MLCSKDYADISDILYERADLEDLNRIEELVRKVKITKRQEVRDNFFENFSELEKAGAVITDPQGYRIEGFMVTWNNN